MTQPDDPQATGPPAARVLYIDDSPTNLRLVSRIFERQGDAVVVIPALLGSQGLELARARPDLILLDLHLPDMGGTEVLARLRENPETRDIPVVIISADASPGLAARLAALGAQAYVTKPISIPSFLGVVRPFLPGGRPDPDQRPEAGA